MLTGAFAHASYRRIHYVAVLSEGRFRRAAGSGTGQIALIFEWWDALRYLSQRYGPLLGRLLKAAERCGAEIKIAGNSVADLKRTTTVIPGGQGAPMEAAGRPGHVPAADAEDG
jgi:hypothetical protein